MIFITKVMQKNDLSESKKTNLHIYVLIRNKNIDAVFPFAIKKI